ncbi:MAG: NUDIX domain-containing protein [Solirubrobacteraceae bacterium]
MTAAILIRAGRVLLCHRSPERRWSPGVWDLPGGHIEPGEAPGAAVAREVAATPTSSMNPNGKFPGRDPLPRAGASARLSAARVRDPASARSVLHRA